MKIQIGDLLKHEDGTLGLIVRDGDVEGWIWVYWSDMGMREASKKWILTGIANGYMKLIPAKNFPKNLAKIND